MIELLKTRAKQGVSWIKKDEIIIAALLTHPTVRAASQTCKVSEARIYARLRNPEFAEQYNTARRELLERNTAALQVYLSGAIETMASICNDLEVAPQTRLNAAESIIRNSLKLTEQADILRRLDELERASK